MNPRLKKQIIANQKRIQKRKYRASLRRKEKLKRRAKRQEGIDKIYKRNPKKDSKFPHRRYQGIVEDPCEKNFVSSSYTARTATAGTDMFYGSCFRIIGTEMIYG